MKSRWINFLCLAGVLSSAASATTLNSYLRNREGVKKLGEKSYFPAYQSFMHALDDDPLNLSVHLNIARSLHDNEEFAKAEQEYKAVLNLLPADSPLRFEALFNMADAQAKQKKIEEAFATYQKALEIKPDSIEVKTNIELLAAGGGGGEGDQEGKPKEDGDKGKGKPDKGNPDPNEGKDKKKQPKPFESKDLSPQDVKKILDEIKNQEQAIRADENDKGAKEAPRDKDW